MYTNIPTHVHREMSLSQCRLNVLKDQMVGFFFFLKRQAVALSAPFMCGWLWNSSTGVTGHKRAIHSCDQTDNKNDITSFFMGFQRVCEARTCRRPQEKRGKVAWFELKKMTYNWSSASLPLRIFQHAQEWPIQRRCKSLTWSYFMDKKKRKNLRLLPEAWNS